MQVTQWRIQGGFVGFGRTPLPCSILITNNIYIYYVSVSSSSLVVLLRFLCTQLPEIYYVKAVYVEENAILFLKISTRTFQTPYS